MRLTVEDLFAIWAPPESGWSAWAKPVLFAHAPLSAQSTEPLDLPNVEGFARPRETAAVIDLVGANSVLAGLALAQNGYRPVPLYNSGISPGMLIDMRSIAEFLVLGADILRHASLRPDASPAFLLNAERMDHPEGARTPGRYDNRWSVVPQDMPSASFMMDKGIKQVVLVADRIRDDLAHVLRRYQEAGIDLRRTAAINTMPISFTVERPRSYKSVWYRLGVFAGLRRNSAGGFGGIVPQPSSGGGFG
jgi:hypothetical protein